MTPIAEKAYDLTSGSILNKLLLIAGPVMATQLFQMAYNLIDMFFVGRISSDAVAATGSAGIFFRGIVLLIWYVIHAHKNLGKQRLQLHEY